MIWFYKKTFLPSSLIVHWIFYHFSYVFFLFIRRSVTVNTWFFSNRWRLHCRRDATVQTCDGRATSMPLTVSLCVGLTWFWCATDSRFTKKKTPQKNLQLSRRTLGRPGPKVLSRTSGCFFTLSVSVFHILADRCHFEWWWLELQPFKVLILTTDT